MSIERHWEYFWLQHALARFADEVKRRLGPAEYLSADSLDIPLGSILDYVKDGAIPHVLDSFDGRGGEDFPLFIAATPELRPKCVSGLLHVRPDSPDAVLFYYAVSGVTAFDSLRFVAARRAGVAFDFLRDLVTWRRTHQRIIVLGDDNRGIDFRVGWDDVALPPAVKDDIRRNVDGFFKMKSEYAARGIPHKRGFLFVGPPGNGKTTICRAIANTVDVPFMHFLADREAEDYVVRHAFEKVRAVAPAVFCVEDLDALFETKVTLSCFLNQMDGFYSNEGVLTIATSNHPEKIDPALANRPSRFDRVWVIGEPDEGQRRSLLGRYLNGSIAGAAMDRLVARTKGLSMAAVKEIFVSSCLLAFDRGQPQPDERCLSEAFRLVAEQSAAANHSFDTTRPLGFSTRA